jgi:ribosomal protein S18 acetylase RimI-like enzyme
MPQTHRPYRDSQDLARIGRMIRRAHAQSPGCNAWSFARFDIWAQRKIGDEQVRGRRDWQEDIHLWESKAGGLAGAVLFANEHSAALVCDPDRHELAEAMLAWAEEHYARDGGAGQKLTVEASASNPSLEQLLESRGYARPEGHYVRREKALEGSQPEPAARPVGFYVKPIETQAELRAFHKAVEVVFRFQDSVRVYRILQQAPSYLPELDLILLSPEGEIASFCTAWLDKRSGISEFEPVGTVPEYRKQGLCSALLAEASNRLRRLGCRTATVYSWSESAGANRLYEAVGLQAKDKVYGWRWQGR